MTTKSKSFPARLDIDYPSKLSRLTTFFRLILAVPIAFILALITAADSSTVVDEAGRQITTSSGGIMVGIFIATALMILFRQRYPRWWFDFALEFNRFSARVGAYLFLLTDKYPSTVDKQSVSLNLEYPDVKKDLNRWLPLVKWILAIPHYIVLIILAIGALFATIIAWFAILFTGRYPKSLFNYVVGVGRWSLRVATYSELLITDKYPPFSLK
ncbi:hypothetical protein B7Y94_01975 [Candidatus Saccharibacteria bacterium 32-49-12]|nr:MAG: hypothetical protein B7Y94_01975 [Candidatus Saccharibacteria bacterium 32-49-12]